MDACINQLSCIYGKFIESGPVPKKTNRTKQLGKMANCFEKLFLSLFFTKSIQISILLTFHLKNTYNATYVNKIQHLIFH